MNERNDKWENNFFDEPKKQIKESKLSILDSKNILKELDLKYEILTNESKRNYQLINWLRMDIEIDKNRIETIIKKLNYKLENVKTEIFKNDQVREFLKSSIRQEETRIILLKKYGEKKEEK